MKIGDRIGAILSSDEHEVRFLGYGTYLGEEVPPKEGPATPARYVSKIGHKNPKLHMDSGEIVWGCECWWSDIENVKNEMIVWRESGRRIIETKISDDVPFDLSSLN